ncbi:IS1380 family transposase [Blastococcus capsensis]|uniref:IS1380 family transposase n=1 Tax=Blastococcus capsensis TaxID=1564163 RepID=UPI0025422EE5|nr:IS1380 family transposase [Blastococcus capsensis]MDK3258182.1 IS1380 family transposase [Blastococcus capsensis]
MKKRSRFYPRVQVDTAEVPAVGSAGGVLLTDTVAAAGLDAALSAALTPWRKPLAIHDPGKVVLDLALTLALGGDCLADIALLRAEPGVYGPVASDPTVSRTIDALAADAPAALKAINTARAAARAQVWALAGEHAPDHAADAAAPLTIDIDATLVTAHSEKEQAAPTFKRGFGHHPLCSFLDHGAEGSGEPLAVMLRAGNAGSNTAADHIALTRQALAQLPGHRPGTRPGRKILIRTDGAGASHKFLDWLAGQRLSYSIGFGLPANTADLLTQIPAEVWTPAYDANDQIRDGAWVAELTGLLDLTGWPPGMRVIARKERPHPGAQLRITDADGLRVTAFATNTTRGQLPALELRHRRRARAEDRIRCAKDTGLTNLPLHDFAQNQIWCAIVALACELTAWMQMLALTDTAARRWEPKRLRTRLFTVPATLARTGRRRLLHLAEHHPWAVVVRDAVGRLRALTAGPVHAPG